MRKHAAARQWALAATMAAASFLGVAPLAAQAAAVSLHERGKALYERNCIVCHGGSGNADTPAGRLLKPRPRNFADPVEMARVTVDRIYRAIKDGRPGTAMAPWKQNFTETEIGDLIDYIHTLGSTAEKSKVSTDRLSLEVGLRIYERECASCHGTDGSADTPVANVLNPRPRVFADPIVMARMDDGRIYMAIYRGRPGTAMGGHGELLAPAEIIDVMRYIRTLVRPLPAGMTSAQLDARVGEQVYRQNCIACHGEEGNGRTALGQHLVPPPRDFTRGAEMAALSDADMARAITHGVSGTAMAPWEGVLNKEDVRRVILFIRRSFARPA